MIEGKIVSYPMTQLELRREAIIDFFVDQASRGKGIGSLLLDTALSRMFSRGTCHCEPTTNPVDNEKAFRRYEKRGFQVASRWCSYHKKLKDT